MTACPSCGHENPDGAKFCMECAAPLVLRLPVRSRRSGRSCRCLFCDLVGFTAASEQADPEDVDRMLSAYAEMARARIEAHGGVVEKFIGDAVVGVFGVPAAHEDDPERAVRAGLRIVEAAEELEAIGGAPLRLRVGVNTGETLVRLGANAGVGERVLAGDAINTASRLQSVAPEMGVAVGLSTFEATSVVFEYEELEPATVKGKAEPVRVFHAKAARARFGTDLTRTHDSAVHRPRDRPGAPEGRLRQDGGLQLRAVGDGGGGAGVGEVAAGGGAVRLHRRAAGVHDLAAGQVFAVWGGDHVLGAGRDPEGPHRHPRIRSARGGARRSWTRCCRRGRSGPGFGSGCCRCWGSRPRPARSGRSCSRPGAGSWKGSRRSGRRCWCSRICTGPTRRCSRSWSTWPTSPKASRC